MSHLTITGFATRSHHTPLPNKSKFKAGFYIKQGIDQTLKSPDMYMRENTNGRDGFVFYKDFSNDIGKSNGKDVNRLRVATDASGNVLTAFPEKSK
ncbi:hypothetical protein OS242_07635 [Tumebacillus sp. DT12]|uniref:Bacterial EndoU nuclease domain-containing protein n=1 Tax=Tumebacillus lacus TaxID=2995335 RepID=A0ABT3X1I7_9BACL|nr:hypothetical protein [Tumebacillus lacus]MCX7569832.1 hypothetical protein [Tumebacillus lacus]